LAIPARPSLPSFLNDAIAPPAPVAPGAAVPAATPGLSSPLSQKYRTANWYRAQRAQQPSRQQVADQQGWPAWIRKQYGLAAVPSAAPLASPVGAASEFPILNGLLAS
jgi:hypothetical protein